MVNHEYTKVPTNIEAPIIIEVPATTDASTNTENTTPVLGVINPFLSYCRNAT